MHEEPSYDNVPTRNVLHEIREKRPTATPQLLSNETRPRGDSSISNIELNDILNNALAKKQR
jgi:hypothetical protein